MCRGDQAFAIQQTADHRLRWPFRRSFRLSNHDGHADAATAGPGGFEILAGLMIASFRRTFFAILLIFFVIAATFYFHDFWNQPAPENAKTLIDALKNLSLIGALHADALRLRGFNQRGLPSHFWQDAT
jgi:uncharacterized membrane protein YphA (DoxX/SURF4 family)